MFDRLKSKMRKKNAPSPAPVATLAQDASRALADTLREQLAAYRVLVSRFKAGERELVPELEALQQEMSVLRERLTGITMPQPRGTEDFQTVNADLEKLSAAGEVLYHAPAAINKKLQELGAYIPAVEVQRMEAAIAKVGVDVPVRCKQLKEHTEGKKAPLLIILPKVIVVNGKVIPFTIGTLDPNNPESVWKAWQEKKPDLKALFVTGLASEDMKGKVWGDYLTAFTTSSVEGSKNKTYQEQMALVQEKLGVGSEIHGDMYLAMVLHYLITGSPLVQFDQEGYMRLHELGTDGDPLAVRCSGGKLRLSSGDAGADGYAGVGAASVFSL